MRNLEWSTPGAGESEDILADERVRRVRWWWPGSWFEGRLGLVILVVVVMGGVGWFAFGGAFGWRVSPDGGGVRVGVEGGEVHPGYGRDLTAGEYALAERYGTPLYLGKGGLPVVRFGGVGESRELTLMEAEWESLEKYEWSGEGRSVWAPGPRGRGIWWEVDEEAESLDGVVRYPREKWREKQRRELSRAVSELGVLVRYVSGLDLKVWRAGSGESLLRVVRSVRGRFPPVEYGHWEAVPSLWVCDTELESDFTMGVTSGCPGPEYEDLLSQAWGSVGGVIDVAERMGETGIVMDGLNAEALSESGLLSRQGYFLIDLWRAVELTGVRLEALASESKARDLPIVVEVFGEY